MITQKFKEKENNKHENHIHNIKNIAWHFKRLDSALKLNEAHALTNICLAKTEYSGDQMEVTNWILSLIRNETLTLYAQDLDW